MGVVYKAHDTKLNRTIALKFLPQYLTSDAQEKERFYHEARAASALMHPNVTVIHEINEYEGRLFLAMELVEGKTLKKLVDDDTLSVKKTLDIVIQCCEGLAAAHEKGIVHRDIKSDNIMITPKGQVKIMDFGLAKVKGATKLTKLGSTLGTAAYMSPEQAQGEEVDARSDIFSFGVVCYELLTTKLPFKGEHQAALMYSLINEEPSPIARFNEKVTPELERIVSKAIAKDRDDRYQHIDEMLADVRRERKQLEYARAGYASMFSITASASAIPPKKKSMMRYLIPASAVGVIIIALVIFNPFNLQISTQQSNAAELNSLAVMYFENVADPQDQDKTAKMITSLLITGLSESKSLNVISTQRLYDILKQLGKEDSKVIDKGIASEVAKKAGVGIVITGEILQSKPSIILTAEISEVDGGKILAAEKVAGMPGDDIFSLVDKLSASIRKNLLSSQQSESEPGKTVADVTTHSPEAYKEYLLGVEYVNKLYRREAADHFRKAIDIDSTFAMAYYRLAFQTNEFALRRSYVQKALQYSNRVTRRERDLLKIAESSIVKNSPEEVLRRAEEFVSNYPDEKEGYVFLGRNLSARGDYQKAIASFLKVTELDPFYKIAYNTLAYAYDDAGDFDKSIWAINKYIALASDEANPYDSRGDLYAKHGKLTEAIESYRKALTIKPDYYESLEKLGRMYVYSKRYPAADSCFQSLSVCDDRTWRINGYYDVAGLAIYQGKFKTALSIANRLQNGAAGELRPSEIPGIYGGRASVYAAMKNFALALREIEESNRLQRKENMNAPLYSLPSYGAYLAQNNDLRKAEEVANELKRDIERTDTTQMDSYWRIVAEIERMKRNTLASLSAWQKSAKNKQSYYRHVMLGRAYAEANKLSEAVKEFEWLQGDFLNPGRMGVGTLLYYYSGLAYEKSGWNDKAISQYEEFLEVLKNADTITPEIEDARARLAKLKKKV